MKKDLAMNAADEMEVMQNGNQLRTCKSFTTISSEPCSNDKKESESNDQIIQDEITAHTKTKILTQTRNIKKIEIF